MKFFNKQEWKILWPFYLGTFVAGSLFIFLPFYIIYFKYIGLSFLQIGIILAASRAAQMLFEVPSGAIADLYGRKFSGLFAAFISGLIFIAMFFVKDFYSILLLFSLFGVAASFESGTYEAWVTDLLDYKKRRKFLHNYFAKDSSLWYLGLIIAGLVGTLIVSVFGLSSIWLVTALANFLFLAVMIPFAEEAPIEKEKTSLLKSSKEIFTKTRDAFEYSRKHKVLLYLILASFFLFLSWNLGGDIVWQPFLVSTGLNVANLGLLFSIVLGVGVIAPQLSKPILKKIGKEVKFLIIITSLGMLFTLLIIFVNFWVFAVIINIFASFFWFLHWPVDRVFFQKHTSKKLRASVNSVNAFIGAIGAIIGGLLAGFLADKIGPQMTIFISGLIVVPGILFYLKIKEKRE